MKCLRFLFFDAMHCTPPGQLIASLAGCPQNRDKTNRAAFDLSLRVAVQGGSGEGCHLAYLQTDAQDVSAVVKHCFSAVAFTSSWPSNATLRHGWNELARQDSSVSVLVLQESSDVHAASCAQHAEDSQSRQEVELHTASCPLQATGQRGSVALASHGLHEPVVVQPYG